MALIYDIIHRRVAICTATRLMWGHKESRIIHDGTANALDTTEREIAMKLPDVYTRNTVRFGKNNGRT